MVVTQDGDEKPAASAEPVAGPQTAPASPESIDLADLQHEFRSALIEQELRLFRILRNWYNSWTDDAQAKYRPAANRALFWNLIVRLVLPTGAAAVVAGQSLSSWVSAFQARQQTALMEIQNKLAKEVSNDEMYRDGLTRRADMLHHLYSREGVCPPADCQSSPLQCIYPSTDDGNACSYEYEPRERADAAYMIAAFEGRMNGILGIDPAKNRFSNVDLGASNAPHVRFIGDNMDYGINLTGSTWYHLVLVGTKAKHIQGVSASLDRLEIMDGSQVAMHLKGGSARAVRVLKSDISHSRFVDVDLSPYRTAQAVPSCFMESNLTAAHFQRSELDHSIFHNVDLSEASFAGSDLSNAYFYDVPELKAVQLLQAKDLMNAKIPKELMTSELEHRGATVSSPISYEQYGDCLPLFIPFQTSQP